MRLDPADLFARLARDLPVDLHRHFFVVGSLAAAYAFRGKMKRRAVKTKDADLVVHPAGDVASSAELATRLLDLGWKQHPEWPPAASKEQPDLPAIRLFPPESKGYFVELLNLPELGQTATKLWIPVQVKGGWHGLPTFRFHGLTARDRVRSESGIEHAAPAMMALANLLSHPFVRPERMSGPIGDRKRKILRSAKDIGRVLAMAHLSSGDEVEAWLQPWRAGLEACFPAEWRALAATAGSGLRELLAKEEALEEAHYTCVDSLLDGTGVSIENLMITGKQLLARVIEPLEREALGR